LFDLPSLEGVQQVLISQQVVEGSARIALHVRRPRQWRAGDLMALRMDGRGETDGNHDQVTPRKEEIRNKGPEIRHRCSFVTKLIRQGEQRGRVAVP
jgi:hypothetical protein